MKRVISSDKHMDAMNALHHGPDFSQGFRGFCPLSKSLTVRLLPPQDSWSSFFENPQLYAKWRIVADNSPKIVSFEWPSDEPIIREIIFERKWFKSLILLLDES